MAWGLYIQFGMNPKTKRQYPTNAEVEARLELLDRREYLASRRNQRERAASARSATDHGIGCYCHGCCQ